MKTSAFTHRRSRCQKSPTVSLFPFLAVLICTMGALVPLLLAIARQARLQALQEATTKAAQHQVDAQSERELAEWRIGELKNSRKQAEAQLSRSRLALGHVENHARRLREQSAQLRATLEGLQASGKKGGRQPAELEAEWNQVRAQLAQAEQQLAAARQDAANRPRSYAVIPYEGPHGTYRQPIYIECRSDAIVLQPEGICLTEADFDGPPEAANPLERALRAARELLLAEKKIQGTGSDEPYPLLLVRPDGIPAYYVAREAMKSWRSEIGYELVGEDWDLEFPKADPEVGRAMHGAIAEAREERRRQALLVAMLSDNRSRGAYGSSLGGVIGGGRIGAPGTASAPGAPGTAGPAALGGTPGVIGGSPGRPSGSGMLPAPSGGAGSAGSSNMSAGDGMGTTGGSSSVAFLPGGEAGSGRATSGGQTSRGNAQPGAAPQADRLGSDGKLATAAFGDMKPARRGPQVVYRAAPGGGLIREVEPADSATPSSQYRRTGYSSGAQGGGSSARKAAQQTVGPFDRPAPVRESSDRPGPDGHAAARGGVLRPGEWVPEEPKPPKRDEEDDQREDKFKDRDGKLKDRDTKAKALADSRGEDWGLPNAARGSVGITRPIRVRCSSNRLEIVPDAADVPPKAVSLGTRTEDAIDDFVSAIWEHMKRWGIAGRGMYWRPILRIEVSPDAEFRYAELETLLENSGLIVERKNS